MARPPKTYRFRGERLRFIRERPDPDSFGECEPPGAPNRTIRVAPALDAETMLGTLIHEGTHACQPDLSEDAVESIEESLTALIWGEMVVRKRY